MKLLGIGTSIGRFIGRALGQSSQHSITVVERHARHDVKGVVERPIRKKIRIPTGSNNAQREARYQQMVKEWTGKGGKAKGRKPRHFKVSG